MKKIILYLLLLLISFACNLKTNQTSKEKIVVKKEIEDLPIHKNDIRTYEGNIAEEYKIAARLKFKNDTINGTYYYKKNKLKLHLEGFINNDSIITLNEFDNEDLTGIFNGKIMDNEIIGVWHKPLNENKLSFKLSETNIDYDTDLNSIQENSLLGTHMFGIQFIQDYGSAYISKKNGALYIKGSQYSKKLPKTYTKIDGKLIIINDIKFTVTGEIEIFDKGCCGPQKKTGTFTFLKSGKRKYWRLQERELFCSRYTCAYYLDIFE